MSHRSLMASYHHVAVVRDDSNNHAELFIDGESQGRKPLPLESLQFGQAGKVSIGQRFNGSLDDLRVYNTLLTPAEIINDMHGIVASPKHGLATGDRVKITGVAGDTSANGTWTVTRIDDQTFELNTSASTVGGHWTKLNNITGRHQSNAYHDHITSTRTEGW